MAATWRAGEDHACNLLEAMGLQSLLAADEAGKQTASEVGGWVVLWAIFNDGVV